MRSWEVTSDSISVSASSSSPRSASLGASFGWRATPPSIHVRPAAGGAGTAEAAAAGDSDEPTVAAADAAEAAVASAALLSPAYWDDTRSVVDLAAGRSQPNWMMRWTPADCAVSKKQSRLGNSSSSSGRTSGSGSPAPNGSRTPVQMSRWVWVSTEGKASGSGTGG